MPGMFQIGIPNAALTGANSVVVYLKGAANMAPVVLEIQLTAYNPYAALATPTNITAGNITTAANVTTVNGLAANVITATSIATAAITAAKITALSGTQWTNLGSAATNYSATRGLTGTALPAVAAGSAAGVPVIGTGANTFKSDASANVTFANTSIATVTTATNVTTVNGLAAGVITAAAIADAAIDNATFAADVGTTAYATNNIALAANKGADNVLNVTTYAEPGQEVPASTTTLAGKIGYLYKSWRNRSTSSTTEIKLYNDDAVTVDQKLTHSDDATTYDRGEFGTGP